MFIIIIIRSSSGSIPFLGFEIGSALLKVQAEFKAFEHGAFYDPFSSNLYRIFRSTKTFGGRPRGGQGRLENFRIFS